MKCPTVDEIANLLDTVKQGVDKSSFGPLYFYPNGAQNFKDKQVNQLAFALLPQVLKSTFERTVFGFEQEKE